MNMYDSFHHTLYTCHVMYYTTMEVNRKDGFRMERWTDKAIGWFRGVRRTFPVDIFGSLLCDPQCGYALRKNYSDPKLSIINIRQSRR